MTDDHPASVPIRDLSPERHLNTNAVHPSPFYKSPEGNDTLWPVRALLYSCLTITSLCTKTVVQLPSIPG